MSIPNIAGVKARLRSLSLAEMQATAQKALLCNTAAQVRKLF